MYCDIHKLETGGALCMVLALTWLWPAGLMAAELDEIVVTAQKREQSLQDVPISIVAVDSETLQGFNIDNFQEFEFPGVQAGNGGRTDTVFIRGIGSGEGSGFDQSVPYYIDGVYYGRARVTRLGFLDLERLEVLKGPQPTYLGKNAIGGAFSLVSRRPTDAFEAEIELTHEFEASETVLFAVVSGPVSDTLKLRAAIKYRDMDGFVRNDAINKDEPNEEDILGRLSLVWEPNDSLTIYAKYESASDKAVGRTTNRFNCQAAAFGTEIDPAIDDCVFDDRTAVIFDPSAHAPDSGRFDGLGPEDNNNYEFNYDGGLVEIYYAFNEYTFTSLTSYYSWDNPLFLSADHSTIQRAYVDLSEDQEQFSQEIRLLSPRGERFEWVLGAYYDDSDLRTDNFATIPGFAGFVGPFGLAFDNEMKSEKAQSLAVFGELGFGISDPVTLKLGFRYSEVEKTADFQRRVWLLGATDLGPMLADIQLTDKKTYSDFQPSVTIEWRSSDDNMFYISWKEGFKAGGFDHGTSTPSLDDFNFDSEQVTAYELGARLGLLDGAATLNITAFRSDFENLQVTQLLPSAPAFRTSNAAEARSQGLEMDAAWAATDELTLNAVVSWLDAEFVNFSGASCYGNPAQTLAEGCVPDPVTGAPSQDLSGKTLRFAPDFSGTFSASHVHPLKGKMFGSSVSLATRLDVFVTSKFSPRTTPDPDEIQSGYEKIDLRVAIVDQDGKWELAFIGRNLTDEHTWHWAQSTPVSGFPGGPLTNSAALDRTRQLGIQARLKFF